jgi:thiosulfate reductase cytochrome b subunit
MADASRNMAAEAGRAARAGVRVIYRHTLLVRLTHWINAICFAILLMSGLQIFNAHPALYWGDKSGFDQPLAALTAQQNGDGAIKGTTTILGASIDTTGVLGASHDENGQLVERGFPGWMTIPSYQDLATGRRWHFFFAWLLVVNGAIYLASLVVRRRLWEFVPSRREWRALPASVLTHARLRFHRSERYNVLQKLAYLSVIVAFPILALAGVTMSPAMDAAFPWLPALFGGRQSARTIHFILAFSLLGFVIVHIVMVVVSGFLDNIVSMITGRYTVEEDRHEA